jgi:hypothetical protein
MFDPFDFSDFGSSRTIARTLAYADRVGADLDVAIAGFADTYMLHQNWTSLSSDTADSVGQQLDPQASRNTGVDTEILPPT